MAKKTEGKLDPKDALNFILAGKATFTLVSVKTGVRYTYRVNRPKATDPHFVRLLTGPENTRNYAYMGRISGGQYIHDRRNRAGREDAPAAAGFRKVYYKLVSRDYAWVAANVEIWHSGKCGCCGRLLTVPESIATGIGPVCAGKSVPTDRKSNVIKNAKAIQAKAKKATVKEGTKHADGSYTIIVTSPTSGNDYAVEVAADGTALSCECEWGNFRPTKDPRVACSHASAALDYFEKTNGRTLSFWPEDDANAINRQHRPARNIGDGIAVTSRLIPSHDQDSAAAWASAAASSRKANRKASWQESQLIANAKAEIAEAREQVAASHRATNVREYGEEAVAEAEAEFDRQFAAEEIRKDQEAEEAKAAYEARLASLMKRAG